MNNVEDNTNEEYDSFVLDPGSLAIVRESGRAGRGNRTGYDGGSRTSRSAATTQLASDVGSVVGARKHPFLKSVTFFDPKIYYRRDDQHSQSGGAPSELGGDDEGDDDSLDKGIGEEDDMTVEVNDLTHWAIMLKDPTGEDMLQPRKRGLFGKLGKVGDSLKKKRPQLIVENYEGLVEFSSIETGDRLLAINKRKIKPDEYSAEDAMGYMKQCLETDGVLHVSTESPHGKDNIINVTVIKPRPGMTYEDLGLVVWNWPFLCVRAIKEDSIFQHTAVKETDQIAAINDIDCTNMRENAFATCVSELGMEITITLIRRKHRYTGSYT
eukprot:CAMPEP_0183735696 /NCGR_PEP_ID=MMETSP0737-20130205/47409_1 /TAXON_ID=385413 /ORGANISM="Thalassiosira miniscula, Strain CCMP1093" /LENGTH=324 /DNA_ID=CAMNT_0025969521 /DNA_START=255 /DNA_END=1229 /DNA_ORIENTATION=+